MSYCVFENTSTDLSTCQEELEDMTQSKLDKMSEYERPSVKRIIEMCTQIAADYGHLSEELDFSRERP